VFAIDTQSYHIANKYPDFESYDPMRRSSFSPQVTRQRVCCIPLTPTMTQKLRFVHIDVFNNTRFLGNPLAIVHLPLTVQLSQSQKQLIAREFNLSETIILHEPSSTSPESEPIVIDIFTTDAEIPFAGHPTIGTGWYLLSQETYKDKSALTLRTKAGDIPVVRTGTGVSLQVPVDFKIHPPFTDPRAKGLQSKAKDGDFVGGAATPPPVASIVRGMSFVLVEIVSEDALARLHPYTSAFEGTKEHLGKWEGLLAVYAFFDKEDGVVRTRLFHGTLEDPATGSAASTLAGYLAEKKGEGRWKFEIVQGVEMGRRSKIEVEVEVGKSGSVEKVLLGGEAVAVMEGWISVDA